MGSPYNEREQDKKIEHELNKLTKDSFKKVSKSEKEVYQLVDQFIVKNENLYDKRIHENEVQIAELYEKLRKRAKY
jgi:hypothetical protein